MSTSTAAKESEGKAHVGEAGALLFLLEGAGSQLRKAVHDALGSALGDLGVKMTPTLFARNGFHPAGAQIAAGVAESVPEKKIGVDKLAAAIDGAITKHLGGLSKLPEGLAKVVDAAIKRGMPVAVVTTQDEQVATEIVARLGYGDGAIRVIAFPDAGAVFPRADLWIKAAKQLGKSTRGCLVLADDAACCKSALAAGMKCVAVPTALSAHQDYCGADLILDAWDEMSAREILDTAIPVK